MQTPDLSRLPLKARREIVRIIANEAAYCERRSKNSPIARDYQWAKWGIQMAARNLARRFGL